VDGEKIYDLEEHIFELENALEAKAQETRDLADIASVITSILDIESVLAVAMEIATRQVAGEVGAILIDENGNLEVKIAWGVDAAQISQLKYKEGLDIAWFCHQKQQVIVENNCTNLFDSNLRIRSFIAAPIRTKEKAAGVMVIFNKENDQSFTPRDGLMLEVICRFTSVAIENANLLQVALEKQKMEHELNLAQQVQATFLPGDLEVRGFRLASSYVPAHQVGGDYYDLIPISEGKLLFLVGDVTNKGVPAALVMTAVYTIVRTYLASGKPVNVTAIMSHVNDILCNDIIKNREMFITLFMGYLDLEHGMMEYCNAGHPPALYFRAANKETTLLKQGGAIVGQFAGIPYRATRIKIGRGDRVFCYTDGLIEAVNTRDELYGQARLEKFFKAGILLDTHRFGQVVKEEIDSYSIGAAPDAQDDYTTLVVDIVGLESGSARYEFTYTSNIGNHGRMTADLDGVFSRHRIGVRIAEPFRVAVSEAFTNASVHANKGDESKSILLKLDINDVRIIADIIDQGESRGLDWFTGADLKYDPSAEGGRGLGLIKRLTDNIEVKVLPGGGTAVTMTKYLK
jgi:phosphoserine phosphatase RsbU/P